jgi:phosphatidate phosphatase APP1
MFAKKELTAYPTYGYLDKEDANFWVVPMRVWVHKRRDLIVDEAAVLAFEHKLDASLSSEERLTIKERFADFIADDDFFEQVEFQIEGDPQVYHFDHRTDWNGLVEQTYRFPAATLDGLRDGEGWLTYTARSDDSEGSGRIRLLQPEGLSVVSDIDDTIKVTEVPAGGETVLRRTFVMQYEAATVTEDGAERQMRDKYWELHDQNAGRDIAFHYVSGSPWQMFKLLERFLVRRGEGQAREGFPEGTFHMKSLRKNLTDPESWEDLLNFAKGKKATLEQKIEQITELMVNLPRRKFILIGDSGEMDPEVFLALNRMFGNREQVEKIIIRDVLGERLKHEKIEVLPAKTVRYRTRKLLEKVIAEKRLEIELGEDDE